MRHIVKCLLFCFIFILFSCRKDNIKAIITPYQIEYPKVISKYLDEMEIPADNPMTIAGVKLGRKLFYDNILSGDHTQSCASCHSAGASFSDTTKFSVGIDGIAGNMNSMPLINLGWSETFFWNGRALTLEEQAFGPVTNPLEMNNKWAKAEMDLQASLVYPQLFENAFGSSIIDSVLVSKALAQFERTLMSGNSPFDKYLLGLPTGYSLEDSLKMIAGSNIFEGEKTKCDHCHGNPTLPLWTDNMFHNNGLDLDPDDGYFEVTGNPNDRGQFKTPTLRNLLYTAPYMHDGRFETLEEVINHYNSELAFSPLIDDIFSNNSTDPDSIHPDTDLDKDEREQLIFFLKSLSDPSFNKNPDFQKP